MNKNVSSQLSLDIPTNIPVSRRPCVKKLGYQRLAPISAAHLGLNRDLPVWRKRCQEIDEKEEYRG